MVPDYIDMGIEKDAVEALYLKHDLIDELEKDHQEIGDLDSLSRVENIKRERLEVDV